jgi:hypothetical protein
VRRLAGDQAGEIFGRNANNPERHSIHANGAIQHAQLAAACFPPEIVGEHDREVLTREGIVSGRDRTPNRGRKANHGEEVA